MDPIDEILKDAEKYRSQQLYELSLHIQRDALNFLSFYAHGFTLHYGSGRRLGINAAGVGYSLEKGKIIAHENDHQLIE